MQKGIIDSRIAPLLATLLIIGVVLIAGSATAFTATQTANNSNPAVGETVTVSVDITKGFPEVVDSVQLQITAPDGSNSFANFVSCGPDYVALGNNYGYGYALGYLYGYGYSPVLGYGYGYGYSHNSESPITCTFTTLASTTGTFAGRVFINSYETDFEPTLFVVAGGRNEASGGSCTDCATAASLSNGSASGGQGTSSTGGGGGSSGTTTPTIVPEEETSSAGEITEEEVPPVEEEETEIPTDTGSPPQPIPTPSGFFGLEPFSGNLLLLLLLILGLLSFAYFYRTRIGQ